MQKVYFILPVLGALCLGGASIDQKPKRWDVQTVEMERAVPSAGADAAVVEATLKLASAQKAAFMSELNKLTANGYEPFSTTAVLVPGEDNPTWKTEVWLRKLR